MPRFTEALADLRAALLDRYGTGPVAPTGQDVAFPAILAAFLDRVADARTCAATIERLRDEGLLEPGALAEADRAELAVLLRPGRSSKPPPWIAPLQRLARWAADLGPDASHTATSSLRESLIAVRGIGPATADAILLRGLGRPVPPVDRATYRVLVRHGWLDSTADYDEAQAVFDEPARADGTLALAALVHGLERAGAEYCRLAAPRCEACPLRPFLPASGPIAPNG